MTENINLINIPVLKAWENIFGLIDCFGKNPYNRDKLRESVLSLYEGKTEKSVFRGMAIPTLRRLGLIIGFEQLIRLSANGKLVFNACTKSLSLAKRVLGTIVFEIDSSEIGFLEDTRNKKEIYSANLIEEWIPKVNAPTAGRARERIKDWVGLLKHCGLLIEKKDLVSINHSLLKQVAQDSNSLKKKKLFKELLFISYQGLVSHAKGIRSHGIDDLRAEVALNLLNKYDVVLTDKQFDELLLRFPKTTSKYLISFGRPMGADEKLFLYDGKYYQTISIRFF